MFYSISSKISKANNILGAIRRSFSYLDETTLLQLYTALVRPILEYANPVWSPRYVRDIISIENIQRRATKMIPTIKDLPYEDRLKHLRLPTLAYRRLRGDMIESYKILNKKYDPKVSNFLTLHRDKVANPDKVRSCLKLYKENHSIKLRKQSFAFRIVEPWNSLPKSVVTAPSLASFERRLDKFWESQNLRYNFRETLRIAHTNNTPHDIGSGDEGLDLA